MSEQSANDQVLNSLHEVIATFGAGGATAEMGQAVGAAAMHQGESGAVAVCNEGPAQSEAPPQEAAPANGICRLDKVAAEAGACGLDASKLKGIFQSLLSARTVRDQNLIFMRACRGLPGDITHQQLRDIVSRYRAAQIADAEKGELLHYHQTKTTNLESIADQGGLLSYSQQKQRGIAGETGGSRPDVVQFTRDSYKGDGSLNQPGIATDSANLGAAGDIALVYDQSIMDEPGYDPLGTYPGIPTAPIGKVRAVLVSKPEELVHVSAVLAQRGITAPVILRKDWIEQRY